MAHSQWRAVRVQALLVGWAAYEPGMNRPDLDELAATVANFDEGTQGYWDMWPGHPDNYEEQRGYLVPRLATIQLWADLYDPITDVQVGSVTGLIEVQGGAGQVRELELVNPERPITDDYLRRIPISQIRHRAVAKMSFTSDPAGQYVRVREYTAALAEYDAELDERQFPVFEPLDPIPAITTADGTRWYRIHITDPVATQLDRLKRPRITGAHIDRLQQIITEAESAGTSVRDAVGDYLETTYGRRPSKATIYRNINKARGSDHGQDE